MADRGANRFLASLTALSVLGLLALVETGCSGGGPSSQPAQPPPSGITVSVTPASANVLVGGTQQFTASVQNTTNTAVTWQVNGTAGGNATVGTISTGGLYTAPDPAPNPPSVTVSAVSQADTTKSGTASVSLAYPVPTLSSVSPTSVLAGSGITTLQLTGSAFAKASVVNLSGVAMPTTYNSPSQLTATIAASLLATGVAYSVTVVNPVPGGGASPALTFDVDDPVPVVTSLSPTSTPVGSPQTTLTINGANFVSTSTVTYNGVAHSATFVSSAQLTVQLTASDQATAGTYAVVVTNPSPGGGSSNTLNFVVKNRFSVPTWQPIGPSKIQNAHSCDNTNETTLLAAGRIQAFAINLAQPTTMYGGGGVGTGNSGPTSDAGIYKSLDGGLHWTQSNQGLTDAFVDALWLDQAQPSILLASTWLGGIFRSTDSGSTWSSVYPSQTTSIVQAGSTLLAAAAGGIVTSSDSGANWTMQQATTSPVRILACGGGACYAGLEDGTILAEASLGSTWVTSRPGGAGITAYDVTVDPGNGLEAIIVLNNSGTMQNFITRDGGKSWTTFNSPPPQTGGTFNCSGGPAKVVAFDAVNPNLIWGGFGGAMWVSMDGGNTWTPEHMYEDLNLIEPFPDETGVLVVGGDQGIYMSKDAGDTWSSLNGNLATSLLNGLSVSGSSILTTVQDFSPAETFDGGNTWQQLSNQRAPQGENGAALINPANPNYQYVFTSSGLQYSTDGGQTFNFSASLSASEFTYNTGGGKSSNMLAVDPLNPSIVYAAAKDGVFRSLDWGLSWTLTSWPISNPSLVVVDTNETIYVGTAPPFATSGQLYVSHDHGTSWTTSQLPANTGAIPITLAVDPNSNNVVLLGMNRPPSQPGGGVLLSTDGGSPSPPTTWACWPIRRRLRQFSFIRGRYSLLLPRCRTSPRSRRATESTSRLLEGSGWTLPATRCRSGSRKWRGIQVTCMRQRLEKAFSKLPSRRLSLPAHEKSRPNHSV